MRVSHLKVYITKHFTQLHYNKYTLCLAVVQVTLKFTYVENYPDEVPLWEIQSQENLEDRDTEDILSLLQQQVCDDVSLNGEGHSWSVMSRCSGLWEIHYSFENRQQMLLYVLLMIQL